MRRDDRAVAGLTDLLERIAGFFRCTRIPPVGPDAPAGAARANSRAHERVGVTPAGPARALERIEAALRADPRQWKRVVDQGAHLDVDEAVVRSTVGERLIGLEGHLELVDVEGDDVGRRESLQDGNFTRP